MEPHYPGFTFRCGTFSQHSKKASLFKLSQICPTQRATRSLPTLSLLPKPALVFVTPNGISTDLDRAERLTKEALQGGASLVQIRDEKATDQEILLVGQTLLTAGVPANKITLNGVHPTFVHDLSPDLGVHIRERYIEEWLREARQIMGFDAIVSCSVHSAESAMKAMSDDTGASYLQVGTMYASTSHPGKIPEGIQVLRAVRQAVGPSQMLIGIGGIKEGNLEEVVENGADGVAVISAISSSDNACTATSQLINICRSAYGKVC